MKFQLNSDSNIKADERLNEIAEQIVVKELGPLAARMTRAEVHLQDVNGSKGGPQDIRCMIEVRPEGLKPSSVENRDANVEAAIKGATKNLRSLLNSEFGKLELQPLQRRSVLPYLPRKTWSITRTGNAASRAEKSARGGARLR